MEMLCSSLLSVRMEKKETAHFRCVYGILCKYSSFKSRTYEQNYRAFKMTSWIGNPTSPPDISISGSQAYLYVFGLDIVFSPLIVYSIFLLFF